MMAFRPKRLLSFRSQGRIEITSQSQQPTLHRTHTPQGDRNGLLKRVITAVACLGLLSAGTLPTARAATIVWANVGTTFSTGSNWVGGVAPASSIVTDIGSFQAATVTANPNLTANRSINGLEFTSGTAGWTFSGSGGTRILTLGTGGIISNAASTQTFNHASLGLTLGAATTFTSNSTGALTFGSSLASFANGGFLLTLSGTSTNANNLIARAITGAGGLNKTGTGMWTLSGGNTYSGTTSIGTSGGADGGTLRLGANNVLPGTAVNIYGGTLDINTRTDTIGALNLGGGAAGSTANITGTSGTLTLGGTLTYNATNNPNGAVIGANLNLGSANRTFTVNNSTNAATDLTVTGNIGATNRRITVTGAGTTELSGNLTLGTGGVTKSSTGTLTLSGNNVYSGQTTLSGGRLNINSATALGTGTFSISNGTTFDNTSGSALTLTNNNAITLAGNTTFAGTNDLNLGTGNVNMGGANRTITTTGGNLTIGGVINESSGSRRLIKAGAGTLTLTGTNAYAGGTIINAGTLSVSSLANGGIASNIGNSTNAATSLILGGGTLQYTGATGSTNRNFTLTAATASTIEVTDAGTNLTISGASTNTTGSLTKTGAGTLTLSGLNLHTGGTNIGTAGGVSGGTLAYGASDIFSSGPINVYAGTLDFNFRKDTIGALNLGGGAAGTTAIVSGTTGTLTLGGNLTYNATNNPNGALVTGNLNLGAANRTFTVNDSSAAATDLTISGKVSATSRNLIVTGAGNSEISGSIATGAGSLTKQGTGTLTLSGTAANTFTGNLAVDEGTVNLNKTPGMNAASSGAVIVGDGVGTAATANLVYQAGNQLADTADVTLNADGRLALGAFSDSVSTLNGTGLLDLGTTGELILGADGGASLFSGSITGSGNLEVSALGNLTLGSDISYTGSLTLAGGTLVLNDSDLSVTDLVISGNSIIDFAGVSSNLFATNLIFADTSVTLTILNWELATDYFLAGTWDGAVRGLDAQGAIPMNQITFDGWSNNETGWEEYTDRIRPNVPEPATYGLLLTGAGLALFGYRRRRAARRQSIS